MSYAHSVPRDKARWVAELRDRIESHEAGTPQFRHNFWRATFDTASYKRYFESPIEKVWSYTLPCTIEIATERACSKSYIAVLPDEEKGRVATDVRAIVERGVGINEGLFEYPYKTYAVIAHRK